jgi:hypothetical protein
MSPLLDPRQIIFLKISGLSRFIKAQLAVGCKACFSGARCHAASQQARFLFLNQGQASAPAFEVVTVIGMLENPSVAVTVAPVVAADDGVRLIDRTLPVTVAVTAVLLEAAL